MNIQRGMLRMAVEIGLSAALGLLTLAFVIPIRVPDAAKQFIPAIAPVFDPSRAFDTTGPGGDTPTFDPTPIRANSCSNIATMGSYDRSGIVEYGTGINAVGTFRIEEEKDENKQPDFNLVTIDCNLVPANFQTKPEAIFVCTMTQASARANSGQPNTDTPNCTLDLDVTEYQLKEVSQGVLSGSAGSGMCYDSYLIINRNSKRIYLNFTKTKDAYGDDAKKLGVCESTPRTQVLMNCTPWAGLRKHLQTTSRYCDFSGASDK